MRSRQHVVIARLNDREHTVYQSILRRAAEVFGSTNNQSEQFRRALQIIDEMLKRRNEYMWWQHCTDFDS